MSSNVKQIVVLSGKGGTGKTTVSSFIANNTNDCLVVDCDVDAANMHLVLEHKTITRTPYTGTNKAEIISDDCLQCGLCMSVCRFDAIHNYEIDQRSCEGCGFCYNVCPNKAITFLPAQTGYMFESVLENGNPFFHAKLVPGEGNSGKLVSALKKLALGKVSDSTGYVIIDGPPGIGCPVNASIAEADLALIVTEPTLSGLHDLERLLQLLNTFKIKSGIVINKYDLNVNVTEKIKDAAKRESSELLGCIPYNTQFIEAVNNGTDIMKYNPGLGQDMLLIWNNIENEINKN